jgi:HAMP domain-containing protein
MATSPFGRLWFFRSIIFKNALLFLLILLVAVVPLALRYDQDSRDYEIQNLASKLEFFAERGASWLEVEPITTLTRPEHKQTPAYRNLLQTLRRIKQEFDVDNAVVMRRQPNGRYVFIAAGHDGFDIGQSAHIHKLFPATYKATNDTWQAGEMMHSQLFGGKVGDQVFDRFLQINTPLKLNSQVVAILMLNKFANPVAAAVRAKTIRVVGFTVAILAVGLGLFGYVSARMLRPLKNLTASAGEVAQGNLETKIPSPRSRDEVGRLTATFGTMLEGLRQRDFIRDAFGRYLSKEVVEELFGSPDGLKIGGEIREVTILVSDLRGFTSLASRLRAMVFWLFLAHPW